ncbi:MAG: hypothetical protein V1858_00100 [Candidatus Gottesmanbacteria bacterium]
MKSRYVTLILGLLIITINIYFLPFFAWTTGIVRAWLMLQGYLPYRDFTWMRTPFDLFLLSGWFKLFGVSQYSYQNFVYSLFIIIALLIFFWSQKFHSKLKSIPFLFFIIFLPSIFGNVEMGELLVGLWSFLLLINLFYYYDKRKQILLITAGLISGLSLITKQNSSGLIFATVGLIIIDSIIIKESFSNILKKCFNFAIGVLLPALGLALYYSFNNGLIDFIRYSAGVVLGTYRQAPLPPGYSRGDGLWIEFAYFALLIPFVLFWKKTKLSIQKILTMTFLIIALIPSLLPSFLSYRAFTSFPLISIVAGFDLIIFFDLIKKRLYRIETVLLISSFLIFILLVSRFINSYFDSIQADGFSLRPIIEDYDRSAYETAQWIRNNTNSQDKIMCFSTTIIYFLSNRLPTNKYLDPFPYLLYPYNESSQVFLSNLPKTMVFEETLIKDFPDFIDWPFYHYLRKNYELKVRFDDLSIYQLPRQQKQ